MPKSKKKDFFVSVERKLIVTGFIRIEADTPEEAENQVIKMMNDPKKPLQTTDKRIKWGDPNYIDETFCTTGDVDEA